MRANLKISNMLALVLPTFVIAGMIPAFAEEIIIQKTIETTKASPAVVVSKSSITYIMAFPNFAARIHDLSTWVDMGLTRGWLTAAEASDFKVQAEGLLARAANTRVSAVAVDKLSVDFLDKELTRLNASISRRMNDNAIAGARSVIK